MSPLEGRKKVYGELTYVIRDNILLFFMFFTLILRP